MPPPTAAVEPAAVVSKVSRRVLPVFFTLALLAYLDRANLSFSASELKKDTHIGDYEYGLGGSAFFVGYVSFQLLGTLMARRIGAPLWLGIIMALWGLVAAGFAGLRHVGRHAVQLFYGLRVAMGVLESSAFPSMYYYLCQWWIMAQPSWPLLHS